MGDLGRDIKSVKMKKSKFTTDLSGATIREDADELTRRAHEEDVQRIFIDISKIDGQRWDPPLLDADWHVFCHFMYQKIEEKEWEFIHHHFPILHQIVKTKKSVENKEARAFWIMKEVNDRKEEYYDPNHQKDIQERTHIRLSLWYMHLKSPMTTWEKALECLEQNKGEPATTSEWWRRSFGSLVLVRTFSGMNFQGDVNEKVSTRNLRQIGRTLMGRDMALPAVLGCPGDASDDQQMERSEEIWVIWWALPLPHKEGVDNPRDCRRWGWQVVRRWGRWAQCGELHAVLFRSSCLQSTFAKDFWKRKSCVRWLWHVIFRWTFSCLYQDWADLSLVCLCLVVNSFTLAVFLKDSHILKDSNSMERDVMGD